MDRNENLKGLIRKYFEEEQSIVEEETEEVTEISFICGMPDLRFFKYSSRNMSK
jgi:hypothetical protein